MANRTRKKRIPNVYLSEKEYELMKKKIEASNLSASNYFRRMITDGIIIVPDTKGKRELIEEINRIGVNINQIAKHVNTKRNLNKSDNDDLKKYMDKIWSLLEEKLYN